MKITFKLIAAFILAAGLISSQAYAADATPPAQKKHAKKAAAKPKAAAVNADELRDLKQSLETQINSLRNELTDRDAKLKQAQEAAEAAQATAARAEAAASAQGQALTDNAAAVSTLQSTVTDLKSNQTQVVQTIQDEQVKVKKAIESPDVLHYKGITLTPGGFMAGETVWRSHATGGDIPTAFNAIPYEHADAYQLSEFYGSARQSRVSLLATGKVDWGTLRGYVEADFLGTGITSNNNQSNSYAMRQRVVWAEATTNSGWTFVGGQLWSMATEQKKGITSDSGNVATPQTIDPNYAAGFVWTRQYGFRVVKTYPKFSFGASAENAQILYSSTLAGDTPYAVVGSQGTNGGNYNGGISNCSPSTVIVNYNWTQNTNPNTVDPKTGLPVTTNVAIPVYKTTNSCANLANISFNQAPDIILKATADPGWGHYELFGIGRFAHEVVYGGETTNGNLYGGLSGNVIDIDGTVTACTLNSAGTKVSCPKVNPTLSTIGSFKNSTTFGGFGGSFRAPVLAKKVDLGAKAMYGWGLGRYGNTSLPDLTSDHTGQFAPIQSLSGLMTLEVNVNPRLSVYANYGGDYAGRTGDTGVTISAVTANPTAITKNGVPILAETTTFTKTLAAVGYGSRLLNNGSGGAVLGTPSYSGCLLDSAPGFNGSSAGYYPGGSCGAQTRAVQEITGGYWYDIYKGAHGRLRQSFQYGYAVRTAWDGASGGVNAPVKIGAKGTENMFWTAFRYYLP